MATALNQKLPNTLADIYCIKRKKLKLSNKCSNEYNEVLFIFRNINFYTLDKN